MNCIKSVVREMLAVFKKRKFFALWSSVKFAASNYIHLLEYSQCELPQDPLNSKYAASVRLDTYRKHTASANLASGTRSEN